MNKYLSETEAAETPAIRVEDLTKTYGDGEDAITAVDEISFEVQPGSVVGLLGANGAGKTTMIKAMLGLVIPDSGTVEIAGVDVQDDPVEVYKNVGAMLEGARNVYWRLTVRENLKFFAGLGGEDPAQMEDRHERLLEQFGLADRADTVVNELSRGMQQKVSLASTLAQDVEVAFLDEPTLGLDVETSTKLCSEISRLVEQESVTIVLCSHDMDVIEEVCDSVIILNEGSVVTNDSIDSLLEVFRTRDYELRVDGVVSPAIEERLTQSFEAECTELEDQTAIRFAAASGNELHDVLAFLREEGKEPLYVESEKPGLEEIFLSVTNGSPSPEDQERQIDRDGSDADDRDTEPVIQQNPSVGEVTNDSS